MTEMDEAVAAMLGERIRRAPWAAGRRQVDVAHGAGVSQTMVCRMELGHGASVSLGSWVAVAASLGIDLFALESELEREPKETTELRCHTLVAGVARGGGWSSTTEIVRARADRAPSSVETILVRPNRNEAAVVRAWQTVPNVDVALDSLRARTEDLRRSVGSGWSVSALVLCPWTRADRRRITELAPRLADVLPATSGAWMNALRHSRLPMPSDGLLWTDGHAERFKPAGRHPGWQRYV